MMTSFRFILYVYTVVFNREEIKRQYSCHIGALPFTEKANIRGRMFTALLIAGILAVSIVTLTILSAMRDLMSDY